MSTTRPNRPARVGLLSIAMLTFAGGCVPLNTGQLELFLQDLFLSALAAYVL